MVSYSHFTVFKHLHITSDSSIPETRKHCDYMHFVMTNPINHKSLNSDHWLSRDRKSTRLNSSHGYISYAVFCLKKKKHVKPTVASWILDHFSGPTLNWASACRFRVPCFVVSRGSGLCSLSFVRLCVFSCPVPRR